MTCASGWAMEYAGCTPISCTHPIRPGGKSRALPVTMASLCAEMSQRSSTASSRCRSSSLSSSPNWPIRSVCWTLRWRGSLLSSIGFFEQSSRSARPCASAAFLLPFPLSLTQDGRRRQFPGSRDGLRPRFRSQSAAQQDLSAEQRCHQAQASTYDTTQAALRWLTRGSLAPTTSNIRGRQIDSRMVLLLLHLRLATHAHAPHLRARHGPPHPFH